MERTVISDPAVRPTAAIVTRTHIVKARWFGYNSQPWHGRDPQTNDELVEVRRGNPAVTAQYHIHIPIAVRYRQAAAADQGVMEDHSDRQHPAPLAAACERFSVSRQLLD
jgi:hypothetical protein